MALKAKRSSKGARTPRRAPLPRPGDPLVTKDGTVIQPDSLEDIGIDDPRPQDVKPKDFKAQRRQDMGNLAADAHVMNACAAVLGYTLLGISDREIQIALKIRADQLEKIREHEGYAQIYSAAMDELINVNSSSLQARIAGMAHGALTQVFHLAKAAKKEETKLSANKDILDRAGTKVADQAARDQGKPVGLRVTVVKGETVVELSNVNIGNV